MTVELCAILSRLLGKAINVCTGNFLDYPPDAKPLQQKNALSFLRTQVRCGDTASCTRKYDGHKVQLVVEGDWLTVKSVSGAPLCSLLAADYLTEDGRQLKPHLIGELCAIHNGSDGKEYELGFQAVTNLLRQKQGESPDCLVDEDDFFDVENQTRLVIYVFDIYCMHGHHTQSFRSGKWTINAMAVLSKCIKESDGSPLRVAAELRFRKTSGGKYLKNGRLYSPEQLLALLYAKIGEWEGFVVTTNRPSEKQMVRDVFGKVRMPNKVKVKPGYFCRVLCFKMTTTNRLGSRTVEKYVCFFSCSGRVYKTTMDFGRMLKCNQQMLMAVQQRLQPSKHVTMASKAVQEHLGRLGTAASIPNFDSKMGVPMDAFLRAINDPVGCCVLNLECTNLTQNLMPQGWKFCSKSEWCDSIGAALQRLIAMEEVAAGSPHFLHVRAGCNKAREDGWEVAPVYPDVGPPRQGAVERQYGIMARRPQVPKTKIRGLFRGWLIDVLSLPGIPRGRVQKLEKMLEDCGAFPWHKAYVFGKSPELLGPEGLHARMIHAYAVIIPVLDAQDLPKVLRSSVFKDRLAKLGRECFILSPEYVHDSVNMGRLQPVAYYDVSRPPVALEYIAPKVPPVFTGRVFLVYAHGFSRDEYVNVRHLFEAGGGEPWCNLRIVNLGSRAVCDAVIVKNEAVAQTAEFAHVVRKVTGNVLTADFIYHSVQDEVRKPEAAYRVAIAGRRAEDEVVCLISPENSPPRAGASEAKALEVVPETPEAGKAVIEEVPETPPQNSPPREPLRMRPPKPLVIQIQGISSPKRQPLKTRVHLHEEGFKKAAKQMLQKALLLMRVTWEQGHCDAVIVSSPDVLHGKSFQKWRAKVEEASDKKVIPISPAWVDACLQTGSIVKGFYSHAVFEAAPPKRKAKKQPVEAKESDDDCITMAALRFVYVHPDGFPSQAVRFMEKMLKENGARVYNPSEGYVPTGNSFRDNLLAVVIVRGATVKESEGFQQIQKSLRGDYVVVSSAWLFMALQCSETLPFEWEI